MLSERVAAPSDNGRNVHGECGEETAAPLLCSAVLGCLSSGSITLTFFIHISQQDCLKCRVCVCSTVKFFLWCVMGTSHHSYLAFDRVVLVGVFCLL